LGLLTIVGGQPKTPIVLSIVYGCNSVTKALVGCKRCELGFADGCDNCVNLLQGPEVFSPTLIFLSQLICEVIVIHKDKPLKEVLIGEDIHILWYRMINEPTT
jgi:hypothetical protein